MIFAAVIIVLLMAYFPLWQFRMIKKYALLYDKFQINIQERYVVVNDQQIRFEDIDYITVVELEQPSALEKSFSTSALYCHMTRVIFHLKQGFSVSCTFNRKEILYRVLKQLKPYVSIKTDIDKYKPSIFSWMIAGICLIMLLMCIFSMFKHWFVHSYSPALSGVFVG